MHKAGLRLFSTHWASVRDVLMAGLAYDYRFALAGCHQHHPSGSWLSAFYVEVFQRSDMMHLTFLMSITVLTSIRQEPFL